MGKKKDEEGGSASENIKVLVRCRPLNNKEKDAGYKSCVDLSLSESTVTVNHVCGTPDRWTFDGVINNTFTQRDIFVQFIMPMVDSVLDGFNATVFAYGQSGSGKTHTMTGKIDDEELRGITPRTFDYVFERIRQISSKEPNKHFTMYCSFIELYNGKVRDLLAKQQVPLAVKENKDKTFYVQGATIPQVKFPEDFSRHIDEGTERRQVAATELNADSSRSHSIFTLIIECTTTSDDGDVRSVTSKFNLVDLAGSERQSKTGASGDTLKEGCNINLSLSALGTVIDTLVKGKGHVPFRSSPLTMLLKDSLGGSSKTVMFANIGPSEHNVSETVSTLRFADRAKQIKNKPVVNMDAKDQKIAELTEMVNDLKEKLKKYESGGLQSLEQEVASLTARVEDLQVDLDNVTQGREADKIEFEQAMSFVKNEAGELRTQLSTAREEAEHLQQDVQVAEENARDERAQREEIWRVVSDYFQEEIATVDHLLRKLEQQGNSALLEEQERAKADLNAQLARAKAERDASSAKVSELQQLYDGQVAEASALQAKLNKLREEFDEERQNHNNQLVEMSQQLEAQRREGASTRTSLVPAAIDDTSTLTGSVKGDEGVGENGEEKAATGAAAARNSTSNAELVASANGDVSVLEARVVELLGQNAELTARIEEMRQASQKQEKTFVEKLVQRAKDRRARDSGPKVDSITEATPESGEETAATVVNNLDIELVGEIVGQLQEDKAQLLNEVSRLERTNRDLAVAGASTGSPAAVQESIRREELNRELSELRRDVEEERARREKAERDWQLALHTITDLRTQIGEAQSTVAMYEMRLAEQRAEFAKANRDAEHHMTQLQTMEARLKERATQLADLRATSDKQRNMLKEAKTKSVEQLQMITGLRREIETLISNQSAMLAEKEEAIHKAMNKRFEALASDHRADLERKDDDAAKLRKKIKKMENQVQKAKEKYDEKVCEYEELARRLEEQKVETMKLLRQHEQLLAEEALFAPSSSSLPPRSYHSPTTLHAPTQDAIQQSQNQISDAVMRAKNERKRKKDQFEEGEIGGNTLSELAKIRAAGNVARTLLNAKSVSTVRPPTSSGHDGTSLRSRQANDIYDF